jgi:hypothetical protein
VTTYDRAYLLSEAKRGDVLTLEEIVRYGRDSFGDPDYVSVYGHTPAQWYARGARLLARTAVECTRDALGDLIGRDVAVVAAGALAVVVDPFAGSANTLYWLARHLGASRAIGFELDAGVFEATRHNLDVMELGVALARTGHERGLRALSVAEHELLVVFVAPPWGDALDAAAGLDLRRTQPPVPAIVDFLVRTFAGRRLLLATQVHETVIPASLAEVTSRCRWSRLAVYDIDAPGHNHGVLLSTVGWAP